MTVDRFKSGSKACQSAQARRKGSPHLARA